MKLKFGSGFNPQNFHFNKKRSSSTIFGPTLRCVKLAVTKPSFGYRFIYYTKTGAWYYFDIYIDRRNHTTEAENEK